MGWVGLVYLLFYFAFLASLCKLHTIHSHIIFISAGAVHEQSRPDRDYYVSILMENIQPGKQKNFKKASINTHNGRGTPFDPHSIMMYGPKDFGIKDSMGNRRTTIQPRDTQFEIR